MKIATMEQHSKIKYILVMQGSKGRIKFEPQRCVGTLYSNEKALMLHVCFGN